MKVNGNLEVLGRLLNLQLEELAVDPSVETLNAPRLWVTDGVLKFFNGTEVLSLGQPEEGNTFGEGLVDADGEISVDFTNVASRQFVESALSGLDYQADVIGVLDEGVVAVEGRYIVGTQIIEGADVGDIVSYDGVEFTVAYDVSEAGPGALVYNRDTAGVLGGWLRWDGTSWDSFEGLDEVLAGAGLQKTGNTMSVDFAQVASVDSVASVQESVDEIAKGFITQVEETAATTVTVLHNLGNKYPQVQVVDLADDTLIIPDEVKFIDEASLSVTLAVEATVAILVQGQPVAVVEPEDGEPEDDEPETP